MVRKIKAKLVLRLRAEGFSARQIAAQGMSRHSVVAAIDAAAREGVDFDDVAGLDEADVYARLFPGRGEHESVHAQPDWERVHRELARVGVTLKLLHSEYLDVCRAAGSAAMGYDRFCKTYQQHVLVAGAASRVGHKAGQSVEVDWSGKTMQLTAPNERPLAGSGVPSLLSRLSEGEGRVVVGYPGARRSAGLRFASGVNEGGLMRHTEHRVKLGAQLLTDL